MSCPAAVGAMVPRAKVSVTIKLELLPSGIAALPCPLKGDKRHISYMPAVPAFGFDVVPRNPLIIVSLDRSSPEATALVDRVLVDRRFVRLFEMIIVGALDVLEGILGEGKFG